ncbi:MAG: hypothetical protein WCJ71_05785 [Candidatus Omnitrophota bacterium]
MVNIVTIPRKNFAEDVLYPIKGSTFMALRYNAPVGNRAYQKNNPYIKAWTSYKMTIGVNWSYQEAVNRLLKKKGLIPDFVPGPRSWGVHLYDGTRETCVVTHKDEYYLNFILRCTGRKFYSSCGHPLAAFLIRPFLKEKVSVVKSQGGLKYEESVKKVDVALRNIQGVTWNNTHYLLSS